MVVSVIPVPIGNALRVQLAPPAGALLWTLLRRTDADFTVLNDPVAVPVAQATQNRTIFDGAGLVNGTEYFYKAFYWDGTAWTTSDVPLGGTPAESYVDGSADALTLLQERLEVGMANEVANQSLVPGQNANGVIAVLTAPPLFEQTQLPLVTVHLTSEEPAERAIGELIGADEQEPGGAWEQSEGWLARTVITVTGWTLNPDSRIAMRKALRRLVIGNFPLFAGAGLQEIEFSQSDSEDLDGAYGCPVYWTTGIFRCLSPIFVVGKVSPITDIQVTANVVENVITERVSN